MLKLRVTTIPHSRQRYETCGDWINRADGSTDIFVSDLGNWRMELAIAVHELTEWAICRYCGISQTEVDQFDEAYEAQRKPEDYSEPGDDPRAPYHKQHCIATGIERIIVACLGINWREYEQRINTL